MIKDIGGEDYLIIFAEAALMAESRRGASVVSEFVYQDSGLN